MKGVLPAFAASMWLGWMLLCLPILWTTLANALPCHLPAPGLEKRHSVEIQTTPVTVAKRGIPGLPGDIEYMSFYGSLISVPTLLSVMGVQTDYNVQRSYYGSTLNALYYKQSRDLLRLHEAQLIRQQEPKYIQAGEGWQGMVYGKSNTVIQSAAVPSSRSADAVVNDVGTDKILHELGHGKD